MKTALRFCFPCLFLFLVVATVHAHAELLTAAPAPGTLVSNPVGEIRLTFSEAISGSSEIILFKDNFQPVPGIAAQVDSANPAILVAAVPTLAGGMYTVQWTAVSGDGHPVSGSYAFRVSAAGLPFAQHQLWLFGLSLLFISTIVVLWQRGRKR